MHSEKTTDTNHRSETKCEKRFFRGLFGRREFSMKGLSLLMLVGYLLLMLPLVLIAQYDFPSSDDFSMALQARLAYMEYGSVSAAVAAAVQKTITLYLTWTGYYTSSLFTTISAATFRTEWYGLNAIMVFAVLHVSVGVFLYVLLERALGMNRYARRCVMIAVWFLMVQMMPEGGARVEAFYWYSGAGNYSLTFSVLLLYISFLLLTQGAGAGAGRTIFLILSCLFGFLAGGGNYMSALTGAILTFLALILMFLNRTGILQPWLTQGHIFRRISWRWTMVPAMLCMLAGFVLNCAAPGNSVRGSGASGFGAGKAIAVSLWATLRYPLDEWMNWTCILIFLLLAILFWNTSGSAIREGRVTFRHPVVMTVFTYGIVSASVTPCYYALGNIDAGRLQALFWMQFILSAVLLEWYLVGWAHSRFGCRADPGEGKAHASVTGPEAMDGGGTHVTGIRLAAFLVTVLVGGSVLCTAVNPDYYTFTCALEDLLNGNAAEYARENAARLAILEDETVTDAVLNRYDIKPDLLFYSDIETDPEDWSNVRIAEYFGKDSVRGE